MNSEFAAQPNSCRSRAVLAGLPPDAGTGSKSAIFTKRNRGLFFRLLNQCLYSQ
jgi:hypothetical protein